eukprot:CAMPEP_0178430670 /NCGR_PEP_ID=MMETSP0689_2-20121128/31442_1 /TAXON_ID=160604 /ORGANISM="Amphidinium massartii, Strain CS-259" /LENGTH=133 /DNA_ID=CAMNT_0020052539 /DNA_START=78 /DNA_END=479 /DNA_ORIENTATION=+
MARVIAAVALACVAFATFSQAFVAPGVPQATATRDMSAEVSLRGSSSTVNKGESAWMPTLFASAALGLMVSLASPQAASAEFTKIPTVNADKVSAKVPSKAQRLQVNKEKVDKAKKNKSAPYSDTSEAARVFA